MKRSKLQSPATIVARRRNWNKMRVKGMIATCGALSHDMTLFPSEKVVFEECKRKMEGLIKKWPRRR